MEGEQHTASYEVISPKTTCWQQGSDAYAMSIHTRLTAVQTTHCCLSEITAASLSSGPTLCEEKQYKHQTKWSLLPYTICHCFDFYMGIFHQALILSFIPPDLFQNL